MSGALETRESAKAVGECAANTFGAALRAKEEIAPAMKLRRDWEDVGSCITPSLELSIVLADVLVELGSEFFHFSIFEDDFASVLIVKGDFCRHRATEDLLIDVAELTGDELSEPSRICGCVSVADYDARAEDGEAPETDAAHSVFFHAHHAHVAKSAFGCASDGGKEAEPFKPGGVTSAREGAYDAEFKTFQFFFGPAHGSGADADATDGAGWALGENFAGQGRGTVGEVGCAGIEDDVSNAWSRRDGFAGDHDDFATVGDGE